MPPQGRSLSAATKRKALDVEDTDDDGARGSPAKRTRASGVPPTHFIPLEGAPSRASSSHQEHSEEPLVENSAVSSTSRRPVTYQKRGPRAGAVSRQLTSPGHDDQSSGHDHVSNSSESDDELAIPSPRKSKASMTAAKSRQAPARSSKRVVVEIVSPLVPTGRSLRDAIFTSSRRSPVPKQANKSLSSRQRPRSSPHAVPDSVDQDDSDDNLIISPKQKTKPKNSDETSESGYVDRPSRVRSSPSRQSKKTLPRPTNPRNTRAGPVLSKGKSKDAHDATTTYMPLPKLQGTIPLLRVPTPPPTPMSAEKKNMEKRGHPVSSIAKKPPRRRSGLASNRSNRASNKEHESETEAESSDGERTSPVPRSSTKRSTRSTRTAPIEDVAAPKPTARRAKKSAIEDGVEVIDSDSEVPTRRTLRRGRNPSDKYAKDEKDDSSEGAHRDNGTSPRKTGRGKAKAVDVDETQEEEEEEEEEVVLTSASKRNNRKFPPSSDDSENSEDDQPRQLRASTSKSSQLDARKSSSTAATSSKPRTTTKTGPPRGRPKASAAQSKKQNAEVGNASKASPQRQRASRAKEKAARPASELPALGPSSFRELTNGKVSAPLFEVPSSSDDENRETTVQNGSASGNSASSIQRALDKSMSEPTSPFQTLDSIDPEHSTEGLNGIPEPVSPVKSVPGSLPSSFPHDSEFIPILEAQQRAVLHNLNSFEVRVNEPNLYRHLRPHLEPLETILRRTIEHGEGNSCLLLGPRGSGKSSVRCF